MTFQRLRALSRNAAQWGAEGLSLGFLTVSSGALACFGYQLGSLRPVLYKLTDLDMGEGEGVAYDGQWVFGSTICCLSRSPSVHVVSGCSVSKPLLERLVLLL